MLNEAIVIGAVMGAVYELGEKGWIPAWGPRRQQDDLPHCWAKLGIVAMAFIIISTYTETGRGFMLVSLCWLGAVKLAQMVLTLLPRGPHATG